jgi:oligopeptidase B
MTEFINSYPITNKIPYTSKFGNVEGEFRGSDKDKLMNPPIEIVDDYNWIRDDTRKNKEVLEHIDNENMYTNSIIDPHNEFKKNIYQEIKSYIRESYDTYNYSKSGNSQYKYFSRFIEGKDYNQECRINTETNKVDILLDINELAINKNQCNVTSFQVSPDHKYISYGVDYDGSEKYDLVIKDIENNKELNNNIPKLAYCSFFWMSPIEIYYLIGDEKNRLYQVWLYDLETEINKLVYLEDNEEFDLSINFSEDYNYIFISSGNYDSNFYMYIDFKVNPLKYHIFEPLKEGVKYNLYHHQGIFYILTNKDDSTNWKIMKCNVNNKVWSDFIPYNLNVYISEIQLFKNNLVFESKINGNIYLNIYDFVTDKIKVISYLEDNTYSLDEYINNKTTNITSYVYTLGLGYNFIYDTNILNVRFTSLTSPSKLIDYNMNTLENKVVYEHVVPNYDESLYECKRLWVPHESIPISIVYKKDKFIKDGSMPLYLYGYGSYGHTVDPNFSYKILPLLDRGYIYAIAHVRGGSFLGYDWYLQGKMFNKMNTFSDFIKCAEYMIEEKYTSKKNIVTEGRSAGGLLIGATVTMRPDLFKTVIPGVPFIDVINTMSDSKIPLTIEEWTQWGNPNEEKDYEYMKQYCPYTNIKKCDYPNMYLTCGLHDPRVPYWEPLKFLAKIREYKTDSNIQVIRVETEQGHFGGSSRYKFIDELSELYTFIFNY